MDYYEEVVNLLVVVIGIDFVYDYGDLIKVLKVYGFLEDKYLVVGVVDGWNVWCSDLDVKLELFMEIMNYVVDGKLIV